MSVSSLAHALEEFPGLMQTELEMACAPPCTICHTSPAGGSETAAQPFALNVYAMRDALALPVLDESTLPAILAGLETNPCPPEAGICAAMPCTVCDIDGNGEGDILALRNNKNPNNSVALECPVYGCGASIAPESQKRRPIDGAAALVALGAAIVVVRRFRR